MTEELAGPKQRRELQTARDKTLVGVERHAVHRRSHSTKRTIEVCASKSPLADVCVARLGEAEWTRGERRGKVDSAWHGSTIPRVRDRRGIYAQPCVRACVRAAARV